MVINDDRCVLCGLEPESIAYLFFSCTYSRGLCRAVAAWLSIQGIPIRYSEWVHWITHMAGRKQVRAQVVVAAIAAVVSIL